MTPVRRLIFLLLLAAIGGAAYNWLRGRSTQPATDNDAPAWPPLESTDADATNAIDATNTIDATEPDPPAAPDASPVASTWVEPAADGSCPEGYPIKANANSGIFHVPGGRFYARTNAERCYATADAAAADGYRQAKS